METKNIHIGSLIKQKLEDSSLTISQFAARINCDRTTVYDIFKRKSVDVERLLLISEVLHYNFLWEVYLKNNPIMAYSKGSSFTVEMDGEEKDKAKKSCYINICLEIIK